MDKNMEFREIQEDEIAQRLGFAEVTYFEAVCDYCDYEKYDVYQHDKIESVLFADGWRVDNDEMLCPKCATIKNKI